MIHNFHGLDNFIWAIGVVEDRFDPQFLGRCKVRYFGWHTQDKEEIPTDTLPWSYPMLPLDCGTNPVGPLEGDWIFAFFRDGKVAQEPVMVGKIQGLPEKEADPTIGFYDPRPDSILVGHQVPRDPEPPEQHDDGSGTFWDERSPKSRFPEKRYLKEAHIHRIGRSEHIEETIVQQKRDNVHIGQDEIPAAAHEAGTGSDVDSPGFDFAEPPTPFAAGYPYNHIYASEGGHFTEVDDTPNCERLHRYHRIGTFEEIHPDGSRVTKVVNDDTRIVLRQDHEHIEAAKLSTTDWFRKDYVNKDELPGFNWDQTVGAGGSHNVSTDDGNVNVHVKGDWNVRTNKETGKGFITVECDEDCTFLIHGNLNITVDKDANIHVKENVNLKVDKDMNVEIDGDLNETIKGNYKRFVAGKTDEISLGRFRRMSPSYISDTAPVIYHDAFITNCMAELTGHMIDNCGCETMPGPASPGFNFFSEFTGSLTDLDLMSFVTMPAAVMANIFTTLEALFESFITNQITDFMANLFTQKKDSKDNRDKKNTKDGVEGAPEGSATGPATGDPGGPQGPTVGMDGPGGFLFKPSGANSGVATVLYNGQGGVAAYQAVADGTNADGSTRYKAGNKIADATYVKNFHGDGRGIHRFPQSGASMGSGPIIVSAGGQSYVVSNPSKRHD